MIRATLALVLALFACIFGCEAASDSDPLLAVENTTADAGGGYDGGFSADGGSSSKEVNVATCVPNCSNRQCGDNGCGGTCGNCGVSQFCNSQTWLCETPPLQTVDVVETADTTDSVSDQDTSVSMTDAASDVDSATAECQVDNDCKKAFVAVCSKGTCVQDCRKFAGSGCNVNGGYCDWNTGLCETNADFDCRIPPYKGQCTKGLVCDEGNGKCKAPSTDSSGSPDTFSGTDAVEVGNTDAATGTDTVIGTDAAPGTDATIDAGSSDGSDTQDTFEPFVKPMVCTITSLSKANFTFYGSGVSNLAAVKSGWSFPISSENHEIFFSTGDLPYASFNMSLGSVWTYGADYMTGGYVLNGDWSITCEGIALQFKQATFSKATCGDVLAPQSWCVWSSANDHRIVVRFW